MVWVLSLAFLGTALLVTGAPTVHAKPPIKAKNGAGTTKTVNKASVAGKPTPSRSSPSTVAGKRQRRKGTTRTARIPAPTYQLHPDPERYQQIQQALMDRGYFKGEVNGTWGDDSVDALRRFQTDQKLSDEGKITALSLTNLGLGPRHDGSTATTVPLQPAPDPPSEVAPPSNEPPQ